MINRNETMTLEEALATKSGNHRAKRQHKETAGQISLFKWRQLRQGTIPELKWLHSSGNGYNLGSRAAGGIANASGRTKGVWDVFLPVPRVAEEKTPCGANLSISFLGGLYIEMKQPGEKLTKDQAEFRDDLQGCFEFAICYSWEEAKDAILDYLGRAK